MKMTLQCIWYVADINAGLYIIKNTSTLGNTCDLGFARTVAFKIGFDASKKGYGLISFLTDGMYMHIGDKEELVEYLNKNDFRPLRKSEYITMLNSTEQGFIEY